MKKKKREKKPKYFADYFEKSAVYLTISLK